MIMDDNISARDILADGIITSSHIVSTTEAMPQLRWFQRHKVDVPRLQQLWIVRTNNDISTEWRDVPVATA